MADPELKPIDNEEVEGTPGYKPPAQKTLEEIQKQDADDESLNEYKKKLLGQLPANVDPNVPNVVVEQMIFAPKDRDPIVLELSGDLSRFNENPFVIKEGVQYNIKIIFKVNREIVSGLKYFQVTYRKGMPVDKTDFMVGSYGPKVEAHEYVTAVDTAPKGALYRGAYKIKSKFTDDDKNIILEWHWAMNIKKDWA